MNGQHNSLHDVCHGVRFSTADCKDALVNCHMGRDTPWTTANNIKPITGVDDWIIGTK